MLNAERIRRIMKSLPSHVKIRMREDGSPHLATASEVRAFLIERGAVSEKMVEDALRARYPALIRTDTGVLYLENENFH